MKAALISSDDELVLAEQKRADQMHRHADADQREHDGRQVEDRLDAPALRLLRLFVPGLDRFAHQGPFRDRMLRLQRM